MNQVRNWCIYKITNPTGAIYIGKTKDLKGRTGNYRRLNCKDQPLLYNSFCKYGFQNHSIDVIDEFTSNLSYANGREITCIRSYMSNLTKWRDRNGLNLTNGGDGAIGRKATREQSEKLSKLRTGRVLSEEVKKKIILNLKDAPNGMLGRKHTKESREKMSKTRNGKPSKRKGIPMSEEQKIKVSIAKGSPVLQYDENGVFVAEYHSLKEAGRQLGFPSSSIHWAISGERRRARNFIFKYK